MNGTNDDLKRAADGLVQIAEDKAAAAVKTTSEVHADVLATAQTANWNPKAPKQAQER